MPSWTVVIDGWCIKRYGMHRMCWRDVSLSGGRPVDGWLCGLWRRHVVVYGRRVKQQRLYRMRSGEVLRVVRAEYDRRLHLMCRWFLVIRLRRHQPITMHRLCGWSVLLVIWSVDGRMCELWCRVVVVCSGCIKQQRLYRMRSGEVP